MAWNTVGNLKGPKGDPGEQGIQGIQGEKGDQGNQGAAGTAATISVGTVTTLDAGAAANITNSGNSNAAVFNFEIPRGAQGLKGDKGDKGDQGEQGIQGVAGVDGAYVESTTVLGDGNLQITLSNGTDLTAGYVVGPPGEDGTSVNIQGSVPSVGDLPTNLTAGDAGTGYIDSSTGHLHVWSGTDWTDVGNIKGPKGDKGDKGDTGTRGSRWFTGAGTPTEGSIVGAIPGDMYLDTVSGDTFKLS